MIILIIITLMSRVKHCHIQIEEREFSLTLNYPISCCLFLSLFRTELQWGATESGSLLRSMNSVSPSAAQYVGNVMQDELAEDRRQQPLERQGSFSLRLPQAADSSREPTGEPDDMDKLKAKIMSTWNSIKYGQWNILGNSVCCLYFQVKLFFTM